jgi:hypothetical protein
MPATLLLSDDFEGYAPGYSGMPTGFFPIGVVFFQDVIDFSHGGFGGELLMNGAFLGKSDHGYYFGGEIAHADASTQESTFYQQFAITDHDSIIGGGGVAYATADPVNPGTNNIVIFRVAFNNDATLIVSFAGGSFFISGTQIMNLNVWDWMQVNGTIGSTIVGGIPLITAQVDVCLHGIVILSTPTVITNINSSTAPGGPNVNLWLIFSGGNIDFGSYIDNIYIYSGLVTNGTFPAPGTPKVRMSEAVVEYAKLPDSANIRMTEGLIEYVKLPSSANLRMSQGVIELIRGANPGGGAMVYEA